MATTYRQIEIDHVSRYFTLLEKTLDGLIEHYSAREWKNNSSGSEASSQDKYPAYIIQTYEMRTNLERMLKSLEKLTKKAQNIATLVSAIEEGMQLTDLDEICAREEEEREEEDN